MPCSGAVCTAVRGEMLSSQSRPFSGTLYKGRRTRFLFTRQLVDESSKRYMFTDAAASTAAREGAAPGSRGEDTLHRDGDQSDWQDQQQEQEQQQEEHRGEPGPRWEGLDEERRQQEREEQNAQLARDRLEQQERDVRLDALRNLSPEEYLDQTGVSVVMQEALGLLAELRPCTPLQTFSDM